MCHETFMTRLTTAVDGHSAFYVFNFVGMTCSHQIDVQIHNPGDLLNNLPYWRSLQSLINHDRSEYLASSRRQQSMAFSNPAHISWHVQAQEYEADLISPLYFKEFWLRDGTYQIWSTQPPLLSTDEIFFGDYYLSTSTQALDFLYHKRKPHLFEPSDFYVTFGFSRNGALPIKEECGSRTRSHQTQY